VLRRFFLVLAIGVFVVLPSATLADDGQGNDEHSGANRVYEFCLQTSRFCVAPNTSAAADGSTVTMIGSGAFASSPVRFATGGGTYVIKNAVGGTVASGTWTMRRLLSFVDYGSVANPSLAFLHGGEGKFLVNLDGIGQGLLTITCVEGSPPPGKEEGIMLSLHHGLDFSKPTSGDTQFFHF